MKTSDFDYALPQELIAQTPIEPRDSSRLMVVNRSSGNIEHRHFYDISGLLKPGDVLVMNNSRVIPARIFGKKADTGAAVEILLLRHSGTADTWEALVKPGKKLQIGAIINLESQNNKSITAEVISVHPDGIRDIRLSDNSLLREIGHIPLPPYIHAPLVDPARYQTVYAEDDGSAAAPTAGLHFTPQLLGELEAKGVECLYTTLHIGLDTFRPIHVDDPAQHHIHREFGTVSQHVAKSISSAKQEGRRVVCVGTTSVRLLEFAALQSTKNVLDPFEGWVDLLILPGHRFHIPDAMVTNFHLPKSTLLMMVSAYAGTELIKKAYAEAIKEQYRFYSFGDAMLIV